MKNNLLLNITLHFILVASLIIGTAVSSFFFIKALSEQNEVKEEQFLATTTPDFKIEKTETLDYYLYRVEDYERSLSYAWKFVKDRGNHQAVEDSLLIEEDLRLSLDPLTSNTEKIKQMVDQKKLIVSFDYHGALPLETTVRINVKDRFTNGEKLYLYYYNPEQEKIEYIEHNVEVKNGYVEFQLAHCSDYFLTAAVVNDALNNPKSINYIIIGLVVVVFILIAITLAQSKRK